MKRQWAVCCPALFIALVASGCGSSHDTKGSQSSTTQGGCTDPDGDGYLGAGCGQIPEDCAPEDPARHPEAAETCNAIDDNCDGRVDEGTPNGSDVNDCGACKKPCEQVANATIACNAGACTIAACGADTADCDGDYQNGCEVDTKSDAQACGACGNVCEAVDNAAVSCTDGQCLIAGCSTGTVDCDGDYENGCEVDTTSDASGCGSCGNVCETVDSATVACADSQCVIAQCTAGTADCDGDYENGCEVDIAANPLACGACDTICQPAENADIACVAGQCAIGECAAGTADCDGDYDNGCETDVANNLETCGACDNSCGQTDDATVSCIEGQCVISECAATTTADCDGDIQNGCEVDTNTNLSACGSCANDCGQPSNADVACSAGQCTITGCAPNTVDCDGQYANGCESDTTSDPSDCGGCGQVCDPIANAEVGCSDSQCVITQCVDGYVDCDGDQQNGCEIDTTSDPTSCGGCGYTCQSAPHAGTACVNSQCTIVQCDAGTADCDGDYQNGCEVDTTSDMSACGSCNNACGQVKDATSTCSAGQCSIVGCAANASDCDGEYATGCETDTTSDPLACGGCGNACTQVANANIGCVESQCVIDQCAAGTVDCDGEYQTGCEIDPTSDPTSCGGCGNICPAVNNASVGCDDSQCVISQCDAGSADCDGDYQNGCEVDTSSDLSACGACNNVCGQVANAAIACDAGQCVIDQCAAGTADCDGDYENGCEMNTTNDVSACGACQNACDAVANADIACSDSQCVIDLCATGNADCDGLYENGCEVDTHTDTLACGGCGIACEWVANADIACADSQCVIDQCSEGNADCDGDYQNGCEIDTISDALSCGGCGNICPSADNAAVACDSSQCVIDGCSSGTGDCDGDYQNGCEVDTTVDINACGSCGNTCQPVANAQIDCSDSQCAIDQCAGNTADCDGVYDNGCEVDTQSDAMACGGCGNACEQVANATVICDASQCVIGECAVGSADCDGDYQNGCETDTTSDPLACAGCGNVCEQVANADIACSDSQCVIDQCVPGTGDCDGDYQNGCEVDTTDDLLDCGSCGNACQPVADAQITCANSQCAIVQCAAGTADCDGDYDNGCEVDTTTDSAACGGCGNSCDNVANASIACTDSQCVISGCAADHVDCDGDYQNGCEVDITSDVLSCGACNNACDAAPDASIACADSQCVLAACDPGRADCDGDYANGCEIDTTSDLNSCGSCGNSCAAVAHATHACVDGQCAVDNCDAGRGDCDGIYDNGCEVDTTSDLQHCGACENACDFGFHTVADCQVSVCQNLGCEAGWDDCDRSSDNGCEVSLAYGASCVCEPGETRDCYTGPPQTRGIGACSDGEQECAATGTSWGWCLNDVAPEDEICGNLVDDDCNGEVDDGLDEDGDGWTTCEGDCCDAFFDICTEPDKVNPGAFEFDGNYLDDDCDGTVDNVTPPTCSPTPIFSDDGPPAISVSGDDLARAMDLCHFAAPASGEWGLLSAELLRADDTTGVDNVQVGVLDDLGVLVTPRAGATMAALSSGTARDVDDPGYIYPEGGWAFQDYSNEAPPPPDYVAANNGQLQTHDGCPNGSSARVNDTVQLRLILRAPTNAEGFKFRFRFFSSEAPEWLCTNYNDFFLALLYSDHATVPLDHNISFDTHQNPISVNNAFFTTCQPQPCGYSHSGVDSDGDGCPDSLVCENGFCTSAAGLPACPDGDAELAGFTADTSESGATAWLVTEAPVLPGEEFEIEFHIWDTSDHVWDSTVLIDGFEWLLNASEPMTIVEN